jgi:hypothetical protein
MRRVLAIAAMSVVALGGAAGCGGNASNPPPPATTTADETKDVCDRAASTAEKGTTDTLAKIDEIVAAGGGGAVMKVEFQRILETWKTTLYELKDKPIRPQVSAVLEETVAYLDELIFATRLEPTDISSRLAKLEGDLSTACA